MNKAGNNKRYSQRAWNISFNCFKSSERSSRYKHGNKKSCQELVEKWNYKPDPIALSLKGGASKTIGVIVPEIVHYFFLNSHQRN